MRLLLPPAPTPQPFLWLDEKIREDLGLPSGSAHGGGGPVPRGPLDVWKSRKLWQTVTTASQHSLYYRKHWQPCAHVLAAWQQHHHRADGDFGAALDFLRQLPLTPHEALAGETESFLAVGHSDVAGLVTVPTSGTTGAGKRIFCTANDLHRTVRFFQYGMRLMLHSGQPETVALLMSGEREGSVGRLLKTALAAWGIACHVPGFPQDTDSAMGELVRLQPTCIVGTPCHLLALARHREAPLLHPRLHTVLLSGDSASPALRNAVVQGLRCKVFAHYGLTESGFGGAVECAQREGAHVREADLLFEIVDTGGKPVPAGTWGEVVMTTLLREAMPLIRYRTGDLGRIRQEPCACGSSLQRLDVAGRMADMLTLPGAGSLSPADLDALCYAEPWVCGRTATLHTVPDSGVKASSAADGTSSFPGQGGGASSPESHGSSPTPRRCLRLEAHCTTGAPAEALSLLQRSIAAIPGLSLVGSEAEIQSTPAHLLPVALLCRNAGKPGENSLPLPAKQRLHISDDPAFRDTASNPGSADAAPGAKATPNTKQQR